MKFFFFVISSNFSSKHRLLVKLKFETLKKWLLNVYLITEGAPRIFLLTLHGHVKCSVWSHVKGDKYTFNIFMCIQRPACWHGSCGVVDNCWHCLNLLKQCKSHSHQSCLRIFIFHDSMLLPACLSSKHNASVLKTCLSPTHFCQIW